MSGSNNLKSTELASISRSTPLPLYYQLKQALLEPIQKSEWLPGDLVPSEKTLQAEYRLSRITVRRALGELAAEGYISRQSGRGSFVLKGKIQQTSDKLGYFFDDLSQQGIQVKSRIVSFARLPAPKGVGKQLRTTDGRLLDTFVRLVIADGEPIAISTTYIKLESRVSLSRKELAQGSIFALMERKFGIILPRADKTVEATIATPVEAKILKTAIRSPLLLIELTAFDTRDKPVLLTKALYRGDRFKYFSQVTR